MARTPRRFWNALGAAYAAFVASWRGEIGPEASFSGYSVSSGSVNVSPSSYAVAHSELPEDPAPYRVERQMNGKRWTLYAGPSGAQAAKKFLHVKRHKEAGTMQFLDHGIVRDWYPRSNGEPH